MIGKKIFWKTFVFSLMFALIFFCAMFLYLEFRLDSFGQNDVGTQSGNNNAVVQSAKQDALVGFDMEKYLDSVVSIVVEKNVEYLFESGEGNDNDNSQGKLKTYKANLGGGAGVLVDPRGYIVTSKHVVQDKDAKYKVQFADGSEFVVSNVWFVDDKDLALLKVEDEMGRDLGWKGNIAHFTNDVQHLGSFVFAVGNLFSEYKWSISIGVLSNKGVDFAIEDNVYEGYFLTDAQVAPGSSGGPLFNTLGEVIGIVSAYSREGFAYVLPVSDRGIKSYFKEIMQ